MKRTKRMLSTTLALLLLLATAASATPGNVLPDEAVGKPAVCFAPGTDAKYVGEVTSRYAGNPEALIQDRTGLSAFQIGARWSATATDGPGLIQGDPTTLTWSYLPDGTFINGFAGEPASPSNLFAFFNGIYGNFATWHALVVQVFERWGELTGTTYVYEPNDDGAIFPNAPGVIGVRGDVRIGAHLIDGSSGILAYNFFPNTGDMVIDGADAFYNNVTNNSIRLRNVLAHEHGHGLGMSHVCPINQTKLMEPFFSASFDGPQFDDIVGAQRNYGDFFEHNDTIATATNFGAIPAGTVGFEDELSVDDNSDTNIYQFTAGANDMATITVQPPGVAPYPSGPQNQVTGACNLPTPPYDPNTVHDLSVDLIAPDGVTVLASANATGAGGTEVLLDVPLANGPGPYFVQVSGDATNDIQPYEMEIAVDAAACVPMSGPTYGKWNLPPTGGTITGISGVLDAPLGVTQFNIFGRLSETFTTGGPFKARIGTGGGTQYVAAGDWKITQAPYYGVFEGKIFPVGSNVAVGQIAGRFRDDPNTAVIGTFRGDWEICD